MDKINNIFKERLTDKLNIKRRYNIINYIYDSNKIIYCLDNINYCLHCEYEIIWYKDGKFHRDGDFPATIDRIDSSLCFYKNGKFHRDDDENGKPQPAIINNYKRREYYYKNGEIF